MTTCFKRWLSIALLQLLLWSLSVESADGVLRLPHPVTGRLESLGFMTRLPNPTDVHPRLHSMINRPELTWVQFTKSGLWVPVSDRRLALAGKPLPDRLGMIDSFHARGIEGIRHVLGEPVLTDLAGKKLLADVGLEVLDPHLYARGAQPPPNGYPDVVLHYGRAWGFNAQRAFNPKRDVKPKVFLNAYTGFDYETFVSRVLELSSTSFSSRWRQWMFSGGIIYDGLPAEQALNSIFTLQVLEHLGEQPRGPLGGIAQELLSAYPSQTLRNLYFWKYPNLPLERESGMPLASADPFLAIGIPRKQFVERFRGRQIYPEVGGQGAPSD